MLPSQKAVVLTGRKQKLTAEEMQWGFPQYNKKGLLINARAETALDKVTFRDSLLSRRCIIPARWFYEWNQEKEKVTFFRSDAPILYMAGVYSSFADKNRFVILTTSANASVAPVHRRMPLILEEEELENWIFEEEYMRKVLQKIPVQLSRKQDYEQQTFSFI